MSEQIEIIPIRQPTIDNHVLFAHHDMPCPVCRSNHAVLHLNTGIFHPCNSCHSDGWRTEFVGTSRVGRAIRKLVGREQP